MTQETLESGVVLEETPERLKVVIPVRVNWLLFVLYALALAVWVGMLLVVLLYLFRVLSSSFVLTALLILWTFVWLWFGRFLWGRWQYHAANREILFINDQQLILRRPVSILGLTTTYDLGHVSPFYYSDKHDCPAFDYAYHHVYFGHSLPEDAARNLIAALNGRYFPDEEGSTL